MLHDMRLFCTSEHFTFPLPTPGTIKRWISCAISPRWQILLKTWVFPAPVQYPLPPTCSPPPQ
eukprot:12036032-Prorocentrum_lima.AAC.1